MPNTATASYAHTAPPPRECDPYVDHRDLVSRYAGEFAEAFNARLWRKTLSRWHDLGKLSVEWQDYLRESGYADAGEEEAKPGRGRHGGLPDAVSGVPAGERATLAHRLDRLTPAGLAALRASAVAALDRAAYSGGQGGRRRERAAARGAVGHNTRDARCDMSAIAARFFLITTESNIA